MQIDLKGKKALITGGSGGLGRTIAKTLAECGADIAVHYRSDKESADRLITELSKNGTRAAAFCCDVTNEDSVNNMKTEIEKSFGLPEILVVNAVIQYDRKPLLEQEIKDYYSQFESCVMQMVYMAKAFIPYMQSIHYGRIAVMNTECSIAAESPFSAYVAAKRGLDGIVRVLAKEHGKDGITINQIAPGWTITDKERESGTSER